MFDMAHIYMCMCGLLRPTPIMLWVFKAFSVAEHVLWLCLTIPKVALPIANVNNNKSSKGSDSKSRLDNKRP